MTKKYYVPYVEQYEELQANGKPSIFWRVAHEVGNIRQDLKKIILRQDNQELALRIIDGRLTTLEKTVHDGFLQVRADISDLQANMSQMQANMSQLNSMMKELLSRTEGKASSSRSSLFGGKGKSK